MYPSRGGGGRPHGGMSNADWFESRRAEREAKTVDVWPPSPKQPERSLSPRRKKSKKSKRARSYSSDTDSSEEERRKRKEKKRSRKHKKEEKKHRNRSRTLSPSGDRHRSSRKDDSESEDERRRRRKDRSRSRSPRVETVTRSPSHQPPRSPSPVSERQLPASGTLSSTSTAKGKGRDQASDSDEEVGPLPVMQANTAKRLNERDYGGALLRGEGSAMAAFLQDDPNVRIPRRGEIGLTSDQIAKYEDSGYVMSGSRHKRMNAVRMRKENQVISAEEKRGILKLQKEEKERREAILREEFNEIVNEKLKAANVNPDFASSAPPPSV
ncbi:hypothetical protein EST38_g6072 [Candolleomyces aberdarensis]|uniref:NF-kappa-B-activating protein C-terminal domain-containing protein n=1 Tax=Candolleomyces aberdarensis TaxID=2316362 RepID=A0A4Q2DLL4_9AGAR|nr:hypothetical protein EST38_g6072 [Candolleomyces aberdarensis]